MAGQSKEQFNPLCFQGIILPDFVLDEEEKNRADLTEKEKIYTQDMRCIFQGSSCFEFFLFRMMVEHENSWPGPDNIPITAGIVKVEDPSQLVVDGETFDNNAIDKEDFYTARKALTGNTQRQTVSGKCTTLAKNLSNRCFHMEKRKHALIFRLCVKELDGRVCKMCREKPHRLPPSLIEDLPKRRQGGLFWDVTQDPTLPGVAACFELFF